MRIGSAGIALLMTAAGWGAWWFSRKEVNARTARAGTAIRQVRGLARQFGVDTQGGHLVAHEMHRVDTGGTSVVVDGTGPDGIHVVTAEFDQRTGETLYLSISRESGPPTGKPLPRSVAIKASAAALERTRVIDQAPAWRLGRAERQRNWSVTWRARDRTAVVGLDRHTGTPLNLMVVRRWTPRTPSPGAPR